MATDDIDLVEPDTPDWDETYGEQGAAIAVADEQADDKG